ncbi:MAG: hypothetical protein GX657_17635, partial [Chloroflexi bacterium]|nr:hypothetical protein [Chloroflexota bacterium]
AAIQFPYQLSYGEGPLLNHAYRLAQGAQIYTRDLEDYPYVVVNYPPIYIYLYASFGRFLGFSLGVGRAISFIASLAVAVSLGATAYALCRDRVAAGVAGLAFLGQPYVAVWSGFARVDLLALALASAGLAVAAWHPRRRWSPYASAALMVLAAFTRQSFLLAFPLGALVQFYVHDRRQAATFGVTLGVAVGLLAIALNQATGGGALIHLIVANVNRMSWSLLRDSLLHLVAISGAALVVAVLVAWRMVRQRARTMFALIALLLGAGLSSLTVAKVGSSINYFLEIAAAIALLCAVGLARSGARRATLLLVAVLVAQAFVYGYWNWSSFRGYMGLRTRAPQFEALYDLVRQERGAILADDHMAALVQGGHEVLLQPFEFSQLARGGVWDESRVVADITAGRFALVIIRDQGDLRGTRPAERWTAAMLDALDHRYAVQQRFADVSVYVPRR